MLKGIKPRRPQNSMGSWNSPVLETGFILVKCGARALRDCAHHLGDRWDALKGDWNAALETARLGFSALKWAHKKRRSRRGDADCRLEASRPQGLKGFKGLKLSSPAWGVKRTTPASHERSPCSGPRKTSSKVEAMSSGKIASN